MKGGGGMKVVREKKNKGKKISKFQRQLLTKFS